MKKTLSANTRSYPRDEEFRERLGSARLYGGGDRLKKTKLLLERLELAHRHKETVPGAILTIEHVMPQTLSDVWKADLGDAWEEDHEQYLHTLGNLTLTSYKTELGNAPFDEKKKRFAESHVEMNRYFDGVARWTTDEIDRRSEVLTDLALSLWPYFGPPQANAVVRANDGIRVTGTVPSRVRIRGEEVVVQSWADVGPAVMEGIAKLGDDEFERVAEELPKLVNRDATAFRRSTRLRKLSNGAYVETNLSADGIYRFCLQAAQIAGLGHDDLEVTYGVADDGEVHDDERAGEAPSNLKQLQHDFWVAVRASLLATEHFPSLMTPRAQHWFDVPLGRSGIWLSLTANSQERQVGVKVSMNSARHARALALLEDQRDAIERELGRELQWNPHPEKAIKTIRTSSALNVTDREVWPAAIDWLTTSAVALHKAFAPRVARFDVKPQATG